MSSLASTKSQRGSRAVTVTSNYVRATGYSSSPQGSYVFVSPVLVPYVEVPMHNGKGKKKGRKGATKVRYVPALLPQQHALLYNRPYTVAAKPVQVPIPAEHYAFPSYAMPISAESYCCRNGYVSALPAPSAYYLSDHPPQVVPSDLNPLSRPYTPSNRMKVEAPSHREAFSDNSVWSPFVNSTSDDRSSPELWGESISAMTSRAPSPTSSVCPYCRGWRPPTSSDTDSGVGGESDEDGFICSCDVSSSISSDSYPEESPFNLRFNKSGVDSIHQSTLQLIEFLCSHLANHEWKAVARELGVDDVIIQSTDYDVFESVNEQMKYVFCLWAKTSKLLPHLSKCAQVKNALNEIGRSDLTDEISAFC